MSGAFLAGPGEDAGAFLSGRTTAEARGPGALPRLGPADITLHRDDLTLTKSGGQASASVMLVSRTGFAGAVTPTSGPEGSGLWLPDRLASVLGLGVGDDVQLVAPSGNWSRPGPDGHPVPIVVPPFRTRVAAIYADLRSSPDSSYWCSSSNLYRGQSGQESGEAAVPDMVLVDEGAFLALTGQVGGAGGYAIERPVDIDDLTQPQAQSLGVAISAAQRNGLKAMGDVTGGSSAAPVDKTVALRSDLLSYSTRAGLVGRSMQPVLLVTSLAGVTVGLLVLAAAAVFWVQRRRRELSVLAAHGAGAPALGIKAALEAALPLTLGSAVGFLAAWFLVRTIGPSALLAATALRLGGLAAFFVLIIALVVTATAAAWRAIPLTGRARRSAGTIRPPAWMPWELLLLGGAVPAWTFLGREHLVELSGDATFGQVAAVPVRLLAAPLLVVASVAILASRVASLWLRARQSGRTPRSPVMHLAWRRIARETVAVGVVAAATAAPVGLAVYGASVSRSADATLAAQARLFVGADVVATLARPASIPASLASRATEVLRVDGVQLGGLTVDLLEVDESTFSRGAYWDQRIAGVSLSNIMASLRPPSGGTAGAAVAGAPVPGGILKLSVAGGALQDLKVRSIRTTPAEHAGYPTVLVSRGTLRYLQLTDHAQRQFWIRGDPAATRRAISAADLPVKSLADAAATAHLTWIEPVTYTFNYLTGVCLLAGLVSLIGLILYLEAGTPARRRAWVLLSRMGMRSSQHRWVMLIYVAIPLAYGLLVGFSLAGTLSEIAKPDMSVLPESPPSTLLTLPFGLSAAIIGAVVPLSVVLVEITQLRTLRADPAEVLRDVG